MILHRDTVQELRKKGLNSWELPRKKKYFQWFSGALKGVFYRAPSKVQYMPISCPEPSAGCIST